MSTKSGGTKIVAHQHRAIVNASISGKEGSTSFLSRKNSLLIPLETLKTSESSGDNSPTTGASKEMINKTKMVLPSLQRLGSSISDLNQSLEESVEVLKLRDWYSKAKQKHEEYRRVDSTMKISNEKASRLYYALHTLLYTSICSTKTESLEKYVRSKAPTFAKSVFDIVEWEPGNNSHYYYLITLNICLLILPSTSHILSSPSPYHPSCTHIALNLAKITRVLELNGHRNEIGKSLSQASNLLHSFGQEISTLKSTMQTEADQLRQMFVLSQQEIAQVTSKFVTKQDEMLNKLRLNAMTHHHDMRIEKEQREELSNQYDAATKRIAELMQQVDDLQRKKEHSEKLDDRQQIPIAADMEVNGVISSQYQSRIAELEHQISTTTLEFEQQKQALLLQIENLTANNLLFQQQMVDSSMSEKPSVVDDLVRQLEDMRVQRVEALQALKVCFG